MWTRFRILRFCILGILSSLLGCSSIDGLLLSMRTDGNVRLKSYVLTVQDHATRKVVYHSSAQRIAAGRDLSTSPLHIGLPFNAQGEYLILLLAADYDSPELLPQPGLSTPTYFFARVLRVENTQEVDALLVPVPPEYDRDGDHFPDAKKWVADFPDASQQYSDKPELLDCLDTEPPAGDLLPISLRSYDIHPLAISICNAMARPESSDPADPKPPLQPLDTTCAGVPRPCMDADGDGESETSDCDDNDARRHHGNPRPRNCCQCTDRASCDVNHDKLTDLTLCQPARCNTSFDYDCSGQDVECFIDEDCDGYSPSDPLPSQRDCDDTDARVHPGAKKICEPENDADVGKDWACDGNPQGGCVDCDLDGDGYQRNDPSFNCPTKRYRDRYAGRTLVLDCNDDDRGIFPGSTRYQSPLQLFKDNISDNKGGTVAGALRGLCRNMDLQGQVQDSNCDSQPTRGCPAPACDQDGDGFANANAGCAPLDPKLLDCNDNDPTIFPGAPIYSKDGKDHDCDGKVDTCGTDADGDGYCALYDCSDSDPAVHPFAPDSCNGQDDDCDGLIDELNPDLKGNRLIETHVVAGTTYTTITSCADSTIGDCGLLASTGSYSGRCVCTAIKPNVTINASSRVACPDGKDDASLAPKCFGATQPGLQTCDANNPHDEDCDGRTDAPEGRNLATAGAGTTCGVSVGRCHSGTILGCDRSRINLFSAQVRPSSAQGPVPGFNEKDRFLVCDPQSGVVYPVGELCNGYDDDCDGKLPGQDPTFPVSDDKAEIDLDGDTYLRCSGCVSVNDPVLFNNAAFRSCGDCDDSVQSGTRFYPPVASLNFPGAPELCDGLSNQCDPLFSATAQDGTDQCGSGTYVSSPRCCQGPPQCIDPRTNFEHCGGCQQACNLNSANACVGGLCMCKNDSACDPSSANKRYCQPDVGCVQCRLSDADCVGLADATLHLCDVSTHICVQCLADANCSSFPGTVCDTRAVRTTASNSQRCVLCASDTDCKDSMRAHCATNADPTKNICSQCLVDADCRPFVKEVCVLDAADPSQNKCIGCRNDGDCKNPALPACAGAMDPNTSLCVVCLNNSYCGNSAVPACAVNAADPTKNICVPCVANTDCTSAKPACAVDAADPTKNICVPCLARTDCKDSTKPACAVNMTDATKNACVACLASSDCTDSTRPVCVVDATDPTKNACVPCVTDTHCTDSMRPVCAVDATDATRNACVPCLSSLDCKDPLKPACAVDVLDATLNLCVPCVGNTDCKDSMKPACAVNMTDATKNACVPCLAKTDCKDSLKPACAVDMLDATLNLCVACLGSADCTDMTKPACATDAADPSKNLCVACLANTDCKDSKMPACAVNSADSSKNLCTACVANSDCTGPKDPACYVSAMDPAQNVCVPCIADSDCTVSPNKQACLTDATDPTKNDCVECVTDTHCSMGMTCDTMTNRCK